jgi:gamma-glutamylcyclotransferase (GGCT)/AIG2-like uncharacterized protein YtfP
LFAYGSLMRGEPAHDRLGAARFIAEARTEPMFTLVDLGAYPGLVAIGSDRVAGEIWEVPCGLLHALDRYEEVPEIYERKELVLGTRVAETYVLRSEHAHGRPRIASGAWRRR